MTVTSADLAQWAAHRRAVALAVSRRVPGVDPELATSRGLELLCAELVRQGQVPDPVTFWSRAALDVAAEMARAEPLPVDQSSDQDLPTAPTRRAVDFEMLSSAMERLSPAERQILWDHHVGSRPVAAIAEEIGVLPYAAKRRLRRAENRLASSFAGAHADATDKAECATTRAALHDFVRNRLLPHRRQAVEDHMVQCAGCTRAFVDVRESYWMLRAAAPVLLIGMAAVTRTGTVVAAGTGVAAAGAGAASWFSALVARTGLVIRSVLTDPVGVTATVAGSMILTTAVTTGVVGGADPSTSFAEPGVVSVSAAAPGPGPTDVRNAAPGPAKEGTARTAARSVTPLGRKADDAPPGLAKKDDTPPGLATKDGVPPGQATKNDTPPGQGTNDRTAPAAEQDDVPPGLAKKDGIPPGLTKKDGAPPGRATKDGVPPGQATKNDTPPSQATNDETAPAAEQDDVPPGRAAKGGAPPGQAKKADPKG